MRTAARALSSSSRPSMLERHAEALGPITAARVAKHVSIIVGGAVLALGGGVALLNSTLEQHASFALVLDTLAADERCTAAVGGASVRKAPGPLGVSCLRPVTGKVDYRTGQVNAEFDVEAAGAAGGAGPGARPPARCVYEARKRMVAGAGTGHEWFLSRLELRPAGAQAPLVLVDDACSAVAAPAGTASGSGPAAPEAAPVAPQRPMLEQVAITGSAGLVLGSIGAFALHSLMRGRRNPAHAAAVARLRADRRVARALGNFEAGSAEG
eukprot:g3631.t1